jgi:hypothetical protein
LFTNDVVRSDELVAMNDIESDHTYLQSRIHTRNFPRGVVLKGAEAAIRDAVAEGDDVELGEEVALGEYVEPLSYWERWRFLVLRLSPSGLRCRARSFGWGTRVRLRQRTRVVRRRAA